MKKLLQIVTALTLALVAFSPTQPVNADIAPPPPPVGTNILPGSNTQVRMVSEVVEINITASNDINITAKFDMKNMSDVEERMEVYFPLGFPYGDVKGSCEPWPEYGEIKNFAVRVDGKLIETQRKYKKVVNDTGNHLPGEVEIPCWAYFPVTFPPGKDVHIEVSYNSPALAYVLETGAAWQGRIGSADIYIRLPHELNQINFNYCIPEDCTTRKNEIHWHYEDFEPDFTIGANLLFPSQWNRIKKELDIIEANPNDAEAWGRLGKAYKKKIRQIKGYSAEDHAQRMYQLSVDAYQKAVTLKPQDADWHYGFADLLCWRAKWSDLHDEGNLQTDLIPCIEQLRETIEINPNHQKAWEWLRDIAEWYPSGLVGRPIIDLTGTKPDFLILTPQIPTHTVAPVAPTSTSQPTPTIGTTITRIPIITATPVAVAISTEVIPTHKVTPTLPPGKVRNPGVCGTAMLPGLVIVAVLYGKRIKGQPPKMANRSF